MRLLGSDKAQCDGSLAYLRRVIERLDSDHELRPIAIRAVALVEEQLAHVSAAIESLSPPERDLLRPRSAEQSFRDGCVLTFLNWSLDRAAHTHHPDLQAVHGTWGPVPWWSLTARQSDEVEATVASRDEGVLPLSIEMDPAEPNLLTLVCRKPRTKTPGLLAQFVFDHCQQVVTGIRTWGSLPAVHRLRAGDRVALPLQAGQVFALTARPDFFSDSADVLDLWQAHSDDDLLEIHATDDPGHVAGLSDNDPGGETDPVPFLDREGTAHNRLLMGRERLVAGDRLVWLSDREGPDHCRSVVFEADGFCQVTYRTSSPQFHSSGMPLLMNALEVDPTPAMGKHVRAALALPAPRTWAPRSPQPDAEWAGYATRPQPPEYWLPHLGQRTWRAP